MAKTNKTITLFHNTPTKYKPYALFPMGTYCNRQLQKASAGSIVEFQTTWRRERRRIVRMCHFRINCTEFTFMLRTIYGEKMTTSKLFEQWENWAIIEGIGKDGFDRDMCILIEVEEINEENNNNNNYDIKI